MKLYSNQHIKKEYQLFVQSQLAKIDSKPSLVIYLIGNDPASLKYTQKKQEFAVAMGIKIIVRKFDDSIDSFDYIEKNILMDVGDERVHGILIQMPVRKEFERLISCIPPSKDVDLLNPISQKTNEFHLIQPTVRSIILVINTILNQKLSINEDSLKFDKELISKHFVIVGQGRLVGKPLKDYLESMGSSVEVITLSTENPLSISKKADILITGAGSPNLITPEWVSDNTLIIDASTSDDNGQLVGDVDISKTFDKSITVVPSPGGIGPLTIYSLFYNLIVLCQSSR